MKYVFDKNGIVKSENTERLVQYSINANELQVAFTDLNIKDYVPYVAFERADGKVSPLIGMAFDRLNIGEEVYDCATYKFSDSWVTAQSGILKVAVILKKNNVNARTSTFNLNVAESVSEDKVNYIDDVAYNELVARVGAIEQNIFNITNGDVVVKEAQHALNSDNALKSNYATKSGSADKATMDAEGNVFSEHYATNEKVDNLSGENIPINSNDSNSMSIKEYFSEFYRQLNVNIANLYAAKKDTYTKQEVLDLVNSLPKFGVLPVDLLPTENISNTTIYLLSNSNEDEGNYYEEYIYVNNRWELIGTTKIDLSGYAKISQLPTKLSDLINDTNYLTNIIKDTNPTSAINGQWVFNGNSVIAKEFNTSVEAIDSKGNTFTIIATIVDYDGSYKINGISSDGVIQTIYSVYYKNGLAYIDGELDKDYYIEFTSASDDIGLVEILNSCCYKYKPTIPTKTSQLINDSGFITEESSLQQVIKKGNPLYTGSWKFANPYFIDFKTTHNSSFAFSDSDGNSFTGIMINKQSTSVGEYLVFVGLKTVDGSTEQIYILNTGNKDIDVFGGIATINNDLRDDYYLTFTQYDEEIFNIIKNLCVPFEYKANTSDIIFATPEYVNKVKYEIDEKKADKTAIPTKTSQLNNDSDYIISSQSKNYTSMNFIAKDFAVNNNPTTLTGGKWIFKDAYTYFNWGSMSTNIIDTNGNHFLIIELYQNVFKGLIGDSEWITIFDPVNKTGLAYKDGVINEDYAIEFLTESYSERFLPIFKISATKYEYVDIYEKLGDISSVLDTLNGEVV